MLPGAGSRAAITALNQAQHVDLLPRPFEVLQPLRCPTRRRCAGFRANCFTAVPILLPQPRGV